ncbi:MAG TPA: hypothetical protein VLF60_03870 [Candidatus Saccharimonadales bacterium]|nr:hypothetical protein [Candidatus Saccharimonadales bacterium]
MTQISPHPQELQPEQHAEAGKHRRTEGNSTPLGKKTLHLLKLHRTKHAGQVAGEAAYWRALRDARDEDEGLVVLERDPPGFPRLEIRRSTKGVGEDFLADYIVGMMDEKSRLTDPDSIAAHERDINKHMTAFREIFERLPKGAKERVDIRMEAETVPETLRANFAKTPAKTWADWIVSTNDSELGDLLNWHYDLTRTKPAERMEAPFRTAYADYAEGLQKAIKAGKLDPAMLQALQSYKTLDLVISGPLDPLLQTRDGYNFRNVNAFAVSNATIDPEGIFAHELTHSLGHLMHDDSPESATTEAVDEMLTQIIMHGEDTLQAGSHIPLRSSLKQIMQYAQMGTAELSKYYEAQDVPGFAEHVRQATGFDLLHFLDTAYLRRVHETQDLNQASREAQVVLSGVLHFIHTGQRDSRDDAIDKPLLDYLIAQVNAVLL